RRSSSSPLYDVKSWGTNSTCNFPLIIRRRLATLKRIRGASCVWEVTWGRPLPLRAHRGPFCFSTINAFSLQSYFRIGVSLPARRRNSNGHRSTHPPARSPSPLALDTGRSPGRSSDSQLQRTEECVDGWQPGVARGRCGISGGSAEDSRDRGSDPLCRGPHFCRAHASGIGAREPGGATCSGTAVGG